MLNYNKKSINKYEPKIIFQTEYKNYSKIRLVQISDVDYIMEKLVGMDYMNNERWEYVSGGSTEDFKKDCRIDDEKLLWAIIISLIKERSNEK